MGNKIKSKFLDFFEKTRKSKYFSLILVVFLLVVLGFILFYNVNSKNTSMETTNNNYVVNLENKLETLLESIENVGQVSVAITVDGSAETVIAMKTVTTQTEQGKTVEETPIMVNGKTVTLKEVNPKIIGVVIVAEGGKDFTTIRKIQQATVSMLGVNIDNIEILTMK